MEPKTKSQEVPEFFNSYHALQYDRMSKLESQENYVTTFVTGISAATIAISLDNSDNLTIVTGLFVPLAFFFLNVLAIFYIRKTRKFIKLHQKRAEEARELFAPPLEEIQKRIHKPNSNRGVNRTHVLIAMHGTIALLAVAICIHYWVIQNKQFN